VIMKIPREVSAQLGLDIGDTLVVESTKNGLVLRKKEEEFPFEEYEQMRAQMIEDSESYDPEGD
jgi:antitoxin component of MazEF toxin-antitoxin module